MLAAARFPSSTDRQRHSAEMRRLELALTMAQVGTWEVDLSSGALTLSAVARRLCGVDGSGSLPASDWLPRVPAPHRAAVVAWMRHPGWMKLSEDKILIPFDRPDGRSIWISLGFRSLEGQDGSAASLFGVVSDATAQQAGEVRRGELFHELQHRMKNLLAVIRSVARRTLAEGRSTEDFAAHFEGRLSALAHVQNALARSADGGVELETLIWDELLHSAADVGDRVIVNGPVVRLHQKAAEVVALALHELTENAVKFGALLESEGRLSITWTLEPAERPGYLHLSWTERQVTPRRALGPRGFGLDLLETGLPYEIGAATTVEFTPDGLRCSIVSPLANPRRE